MTTLPSTDNVEKKYREGLLEQLQNHPDQLTYYLDWFDVVTRNRLPVDNPYRKRWYDLQNDNLSVDPENWEAMITLYRELIDLLVPTKQRSN